VTAPEAHPEPKTDTGLWMLGLRVSGYFYL